jgi:hypothetical protein
VSEPEVVSLFDALCAWLDDVEVAYEGLPGRHSVPSPTMAQSLLEPGELELKVAIAGGAAAQLATLTPPTGRVALVSNDVELAWLILCRWAVDVADAGVRVAVACPYEPHALAGLLVSLMTGVPWRVLEQGSLTERDWARVSAALTRMGRWDLTLVHAPNRQSSAAAFELARSGTVTIALGHPDDETVCSALATSAVYVHPVQGPWPDASLRAAAGVVGELGDTLFGVGLMSADDGVLISQ